MSKKMHSHERSKESFKEGYWKQFVHTVNDFPKEGVVFKDLMPALEHSDSFYSLIDDLANVISHDVNHIVGVDSRGFIFGAVLAYRRKAGFIPVRKKGKLPPPVFSQSFELEYARATLEISKANFEDLSNLKDDRIVIVDDVCATGNTLIATINLLKKFVKPEQITAVTILYIDALKAEEAVLNTGVQFKYLAKV